MTNPHSTSKGSRTAPPTDAPSSEKLPPLAVAPEEAAHMAGVGRTTIYQMISSGELPSFKIGKRRLILVKTLADRLRASHERHPRTMTR
jgi:excisionase family DNA binding protein